MFLACCSTDSMELVPAEVHVTADYIYHDLVTGSILSSVGDLPNLKSLTINIKQPLSRAYELDQLFHFSFLSALTLPPVTLCFHQ